MLEKKIYDRKEIQQNNKLNFTLSGQDKSVYRHDILFEDSAESLDMTDVIKNSILVGNKSITEEEPLSLLAGKTPNINESITEVLHHQMKEVSIADESLHRCILDEGETINIDRDQITENEIKNISKCKILDTSKRHLNKSLNASTSTLNKSKLSPRQVNHSVLKVTITNSPVNSPIKVKDANMKVTITNSPIKHNRTVEIATKKKDKEADRSTMKMTMTSTKYEEVTTNASRNSSTDAGDELNSTASRSPAHNEDESIANLSKTKNRKRRKSITCPRKYKRKKKTPKKDSTVLAQTCSS